MQRVKIKIKTPQNPLFEKWLIEWRDDAKKNGSEMQYCFGKALRSLQKYPFKLQSGKECIILDSFGAKLCQMIDKKLDEYKANHPDFNGSMGVGFGCKRKSISKAPVSKRRKSKLNGDPSVLKNTSGEKKVRGTKLAGRYVPAIRSGSYAILLTLFEHTVNGNHESLVKKDIQKFAQDLCDASFTKPPPGSHYTAWSSMSILVKKQLVAKSGNPARFKLTEDGVDLALKLKCYNPVHTSADGGETDSVGATVSNMDCSLGQRVLLKPDSPALNKKRSSISSSSGCSAVISQNTKSCEPGSSVACQKQQKVQKSRKPSSQSSEKQDEDDVAVDSEETIFILPYSFDVVLLVDTQETDNKLRNNNDMTVRQLRASGVQFEVRHLKVGDFVWICRDRTTDAELVLPYIVERKRLDDFGASIKDGRFHEQKFRLKQCGVENLIYLVEKYGNETQKLGLPLSTIQQAAANTQVVDGFHVKMTAGHDDSMRYLSFMSKHLYNIFKAFTLVSCKKSSLPPCNMSQDLLSLMTFREFNKGSGKNRKFTVREMLLKQLVQLKGLSVEKALAITDVHPTPSSLAAALRRPEGEKELSNIKHGAVGRLIGPVLAKTLRQLYTEHSLN